MTGQTDYALHIGGAGRPALSGRSYETVNPNATRFGLAAGVWTSDVGRAHRVASRVRAGPQPQGDSRE